MELGQDWRKVGERLYSKFEWSRFEETCQSGLKGKRVCVAFSGGADSLLLLLLVFEWARRSDRLSVLRVLHFNHRLRGADSDGDAVFAKEVCESLELKYIEGVWEDSPPSETVSEDQARSARLTYFSSVANDSIIVTGHHQDDVVETMLMRLSRGSGITGLSAPRRVSKGAFGLSFLRPLLEVRKSEIVSALKAVDAEWREDASNFGDQFYRNRLRKNVIAHWEAAADRAIVPGVAYSRAMLEEDSIVLDEYFEKEWVRIFMEDHTKYGEVRSLPVGFRRRFFARLAESEGLLLSRSAMDVVLGAVDEDGDFDVALSESVNLSGSSRTDRIELRKKMVPEEISVRMGLGCSVFLSDGVRIASRLVKMDRELFKKVSNGQIPHDEEVYLAWRPRDCGIIEIRPREAGDSYRPFGKSSPAKLKDLLSDRKIEKELRSRLPVITAEDGTILWVPGLPPNYDLRIDDGTVTALQLTYKR